MKTQQKTNLFIFTIILLSIHLYILVVKIDHLNEEINILKQGQTQISGFLMVPGEATGPIKVFYDTGKEEITE